MKSAYLLCIIVFISISQAQILSPTRVCCDNRTQAEGQYAEAESGVKDYTNCPADITITVRNCVDRTRDLHLCSGSEGARYCCETEVQDSYPRYYALYHPIAVSPLSLSFTAQYGGGNPSSQSISITNAVWCAFQAVDYTLNWTATKTQNWLTISPASGSVDGTASTNTSVSVNITGLPPGTYNDAITISATQVSNRQWENIPVTLTVLSNLSITISRPSDLSCNQDGTWSASVSGGATPYTYQWYYLIPCSSMAPNIGGNIKPHLPPCDNWFQSGSNSSTYTHSSCSDFEVKCVVTDANNTPATSNVIYVSIGGDEKNSSNSFSLESDNYPNPFNPSTEIHFVLPKSASVKIIVYDILGKEVQTLVNEYLGKGDHTVQWNAANMPSGVYFYKLTADELVEIRKMTVSKKFIEIFATA